MLSPDLHLSCFTGTPRPVVTIGVEPRVCPPNGLTTPFVTTPGVVTVGTILFWMVIGLLVVTAVTLGATIETTGGEGSIFLRMGTIWGVLLFEGVNTWVGSGGGMRGGILGASMLVVVGMLRGRGRAPTGGMFCWSLIGVGWLTMLVTVGMVEWTLVIDGDWCWTSGCPTLGTIFCCGIPVCTVPAKLPLIPFWTTFPPCITLPIGPPTLTPEFHTFPPVVTGSTGTIGTECLLNGLFILTGSEEMGRLVGVSGYRKIFLS